MGYKVEEILNKAKLFRGDNLICLKSIADNSVDSVVTDPPYGLSFMGKKWDHDVPSVEFWKEVYRVLKPGGHVLSFGGTRTYHRMAVNIEDAGFEIRDQIMWIYGSGFPKSHNIGKAVDKIQGNERMDFGKSPNSRNSKKNNDTIYIDKKNVRVTKGFSEFEGWGTSLKPANEPICVARKPITEETIAHNMLKFRTGGLNINSSLIQDENDVDRIPSNVIIDDLTGGLLGEKRKFFYSPKVTKKERNIGLHGSINIHPTVKPIDLMKYLTKLVTPKEGTVLDPFMGSGSSGVGALIEDFKFIGMEMEQEYFEIAKQRILHFEEYKELLHTKQEKQVSKKNLIEPSINSENLGIWGNRGLKIVA
jgi:site-specific DNA-methyltransferase (adenine-specific)